MKRWTKRLAMVATLSLPVIGVPATQLPERNEYAYSFPLTTEAGAEFFSVQVPVEVYQSVTDPNLRDAGVYNASGEPVPRVFERPDAGDNDTEHKIPLGLVSLRGGAAEQPEQLHLLLQQAGSGFTFELDSGTGSGQESPLSAYIVDVRNLETEIETLELSWPKQVQGFIGRVTVEHSDDLQSWRRVGSASLADLAYDETQIVQNRVELGSSPDGFLRIRWQNLPVDWSLETVSGIYISQLVTALRDELNLESVSVSETGREIMFDAEGYPPVDRVNVLLPDGNVVVRAGIYYRRDQEDRWRLAFNGIFYNISRQGNALQSQPEAIGEVRARHWKIKFDSGATSGPVQLQLGWRPDQLVFLAQGSSPYELVSGRGRDGLEKFPQDAVLGDRSIFRMLRETGAPGIGIVEARQLSGGVEQLEIAPERVWRTVLLWVGLTAAIMLVGWLVWSLTREMNGKSKL